MACDTCVLTWPPLPGQRTKCRNLEERVDLLLVEKKHLEDRLRDMKARPIVQALNPRMRLSACLHIYLSGTNACRAEVCHSSACVCMRSS